MTIEERAELAVETFAAGKGNCTQSVLCAWEDKIPVDHDTLMKLGAGYGAGMGCMQATCGALIGAVMAAGSVTDGKGTPRTARSILPVVLVMTASILLRIGALDSKNDYTKNHSKVKHKFEKCAIF